MVWIAILLFGLVQGIAEFLPISSSGHLTLLQFYWDSLPQSLSLNVAVHLGTLCTILVYYRRSLWATLIGAWRGWPGARREIVLIIIATLPTAILGLLVKGFGSTWLMNPWVAGCGLLLSGFVLFSTLWLRGSQKSLPDITGWQAVAIGVVQGFAVLPGLSRSGLTIVLALWLGIERSTAARFSFLISVPAILGAGLLEFVASDQILDVPQLVFAGGVAFCVGLVAISLVVWLTKTDRLSFFSYYLWLAGASVLLQLAVAV